MSTTPSKSFEEYLGKARAGMPPVVREWLAPAREAMEALTRAAVDPSVSNEEFLRMVEAQAETMPDLMEGLGKASLADFFEAAMGAACVGGIEEVIEKTTNATQQ